MKVPFSEPEPSGSARARQAQEVRDQASQFAKNQPHALTQANGDECDYGAPFPASFTKGLEHCEKTGLVVEPAAGERHDYHQFVESINSPDHSLFEMNFRTGQAVESGFAEYPKPNEGCKQKPKWRGWESPRAGHVYDLEGPDAGAVGMAPAPRLCSDELTFEMAEVYALAVLRDVPFTVMQEGKGDLIDGGVAQLSTDEIVKLLNGMPFIKKDNHTSGTPSFATEGYNAFERRRRDARTFTSPQDELTAKTIFRGSTPGAQRGPYLSQFMLIGNRSRATLPNSTEPIFKLHDGKINYGAIFIDQKLFPHQKQRDHMNTWKMWLDVQNGANLKGFDFFETEQRFITTPRDLATYVHFDQLYEAYLNACILMLEFGVPASMGFPEPSLSTRRDAFATFGGPHILSLVTEVATRCLKAVRRQKFNYHRRFRPETLGGRLALASSYKLKGKKNMAHELGPAEDCFLSMLDGNRAIPADLLDAIETIKNTGPSTNPPYTGPGRNLLLPMAFPEGSPMHPAYGAGHATVAGGCVTMLKGFFEMFENNNSRAERPMPFFNRDRVPYKPDPKADHADMANWPTCKTDEQKAMMMGDPAAIAFVPKSDGKSLETIDLPDGGKNGPLTIQGELDKLAANISIGRNMAGVHYYSDYYDSLRMGERVAVGILLEQACTYGDAVHSTFTSFDGDHLTISGSGGGSSLAVQDKNGNYINPRDWWLRHVVGEANIL